MARFVPYWKEQIVELSGKEGCRSRARNSLRALVKYLDNVPDSDRLRNIPTGVPLVYELDEE